MVDYTSLERQTYGIELCAHVFEPFMRTLTRNRYGYDGDQGVEEEGPEDRR